MKKLTMILGLSSFLMMIGITNANAYEDASLGPEPPAIPVSSNNCSYKFTVSSLDATAKDKVPKKANAVTIVGKDAKGVIHFSASVCYGHTSKMYAAKPCNLKISATYTEYNADPKCVNYGESLETVASVAVGPFPPAETYNLTFDPGSGWVG